MAKEISWDPTCAGMTIGIMEVIFSLHAMFQTPKINTDATTISSLADLSVARTEPPLTVALTEEELMAVVATPLKINLPCHTVAVERGVKLVRFPNPLAFGSGLGERTPKKAIF